MSTINAAQQQPPLFRTGGMHLIARFGDGVHDVKLAKLAQDAGLAVEALSNRTITHSCRPALLLGFTNVAESDATDMSQQLKRAIGSQLRAQASKSK